MKRFVSFLPSFAFAIAGGVLIFVFITGVYRYVGGRDFSFSAFSLNDLLGQMPPPHQPLLFGLVVCLIPSFLVWMLFLYFGHNKGRRLGLVIPIAVFCVLLSLNFIDGGKLWTDMTIELALKFAIPTLVAGWIFQWCMNKIEARRLKADA